jgi:hypothetical protein
MELFFGSLEETAYKMPYPDWNLQVFPNFFSFGSPKTDNSHPDRLHNDFSLVPKNHANVPNEVIRSLHTAKINRTRIHFRNLIAFSAKPTKAK